LHLHGGQALADFGVHVDVQVLGFLHQQELVDLVAQGVRGFFVESLGQLGARQALLAKLHLDLRAGTRQFAPRDDVVIYFGDNFFDDVHVGRRGHRDRCRQKC